MTMWRLILHGNEKYPYPLSIETDDGSKWIARDGFVSSLDAARLIAAAPELRDKVIKLEQELIIEKKALESVCADREQLREEALAKFPREHRMQQEIERLRAARNELKSIVDAQAEDEGLWFVAQTAPEAYLQAANTETNKIKPPKKGQHIKVRFLD
jgi:hypothetical protein